MMAADVRKSTAQPRNLETRHAIVYRYTKLSQSQAVLLDVIVQTDILTLPKPWPSDFN